MFPSTPDFLVQVGAYFASPSTGAASWTAVILGYPALPAAVLNGSRINEQLLQFTSFYVNLPYGGDLKMRDVNPGTN